MKSKRLTLSVLFVVAAVANVLVRMTSAMNTMSHLPSPENIEFFSTSFQSASLVPLSSTLMAE